MFILHVKHYFFREILKVHSLQKMCRFSILLRLLPAKYSVSRAALGPRMCSALTVIFVFYLMMYTLHETRLFGFEKGI